MTVSLAQLMVPAHDKETSAEFFARMFGLSYHGSVSHFAPVRINPGLVVIFETRVSFPHQHYSFRVTEEEFDEIFGRMREEGLKYGSRPPALDDMEISERRTGRRFHFHDPSGHLLEVLSEGTG
jgi:catechol 2,3-dioxygenase-like lactoylglutathione lyase family enzyme